MMGTWYLTYGGQQNGPHEEATVRAWLQAGQLP